MTAQLLTILLDQKTEDYLQREANGNEANQLVLAQREGFGDLTETPVWLNNLPDGNYTLLISADLNEDTTAHLHLMRDDNGEVMHTVVMELMPVIRSAIQLDSEIDDSDIDDGDDNDLSDKFHARIDAENLRRSEYLEGSFAPYIVGDRDFNIELLDMLDFVTYPLITESVAGLTPEEDDLPLYKTPGTSPGKFTLH